MKNKYPELIEIEKLENLPESELIEGLLQKLEHSRLETFKYVNKLLEVEEKWTFTNQLLKKLNSIKQKQELCKTICDGFLNLTNSKVSACCIFDQDLGAVEFTKISYGNNGGNKKKIMDFIENINSHCYEFMKKSTDIDSISEYFDSISGGQLIVTPIIYIKTLLGYLLLCKEDDNFYNEHIHFINVFPEHIALILENISLYQESEKQNKRKIQFLASISHEFKTPLNSIIGFAEILKSKDKSKDNYRYINNISQSSKHLLTLIEDVLDVSKTQYNSLELNYSLFSPKDEIAKIILNLEKMIKEKNIDLSYTLTDIKISADIKRFRQLIYNLGSNAIKFNKQNGKVSIFTYIKDDKFFFEITDTGDGISKRNYEKIFDFFSQVNRSQLKRQLGSGVGLALCKMITDAHKGEIGFKSQIKKGSTFWFYLPLHVPS